MQEWKKAFLLVIDVLLNSRAISLLPNVVSWKPKNVE